jgi:hypothetical protein
MTMPRSPISRTAAHVPGLRRLPVAKVLAVAEIALLARQHLVQLEPQERRRVLVLMRRARGRPGHLSAGERAELAFLVSKANPRLFLGLMANKLSPVPLPQRVVRGRR